MITGQIKAALAALALAALVGIGWRVHHNIYMSGYEKAKAEYAYQLAKAQANYNDVAEQLEVAKSERKVVYETITKTVDRIVDRPVYRNLCLDDDGLRNVNTALAGKPTGKPDAAMPAADAPRR